MGLPVVDFRSGFGDGVDSSPELRSVVNACVRRQDWYQDVAEFYGYPETWIVGIAAAWEPKRTAGHMREVLNYEVRERIGTIPEQRRQLIEEFESLGGLTSFNSMVDDNVHRKLDAEEFRGFSLVSSQAPFVFVNTNQTINGQLFTFVHELAHVWRGTGGIGNQTISQESDNEIEQWCNEVAGEFLVPKDHLREELAGRLVDPTHDVQFVALLEDLSCLYRCGTLVVLNALKRAGFLNRTQFAHSYDKELERLKLIQAQKNKTPSGGNINYRRRLRIGESFSLAVLRELKAGNIQPNHALQLTGISSISSLEKYSDFLGASK